MPRRRALVPTLLLALVASSVASGGLAPASAADALPCERTFVAGEDSLTDVNAVLATLNVVVTAPTYCFTGDFALDAPLDVRGPVTLRAEGAAAFIASGESAVTTAGADRDVLLTIEGVSIRAAEGRPAGQSLVDGRAELAPTSVDVVLRDVEITGGAADRGGAVQANTILITGSRLADNVAVNGGAAYAALILVAIDSEFVGNSASNDGGALVTPGSLTLTSSTFEANAAGRFGGAVATDGVSDVENSTFVGNTAGDEGGALFLSGGRVRFSTFLDNAAPAPVEGEEIPGDEIYLVSSGPADLQLAGNVLTSATGHPQLGVGGAVQRVFVDLGGNLFSTAAADERDLPTPAASSVFALTALEIFGATPVLADNGGLTRTVALAPGAMAVDAAGTQDQVRGPGIDQRGLSRGELRDAGAFELQPGEGEEPPPGGGEEPPPSGGEEPPPSGGEEPAPGAAQPELAESGAADLGAAALAAALVALLGTALIRFQTERRVP